MDNFDLLMDMPSMEIINFRSFTSKVVWNTYASDENAGWLAGEIIRPAPVYSQPPHVFGFPQQFMIESIDADWILSLTETLDHALPSEEVLMGSLEEDSLTIRVTAPCFKIPSTPLPAIAAECLFASRILLKCKDDLIPPFFINMESVVKWIEYTSGLSLLLGGEQAFLLAMQWATDYNSFKAINEQSSDDLIFNDNEN